MLVIAALPWMSRDALALQEDLDRAACEPDFHFRARKAVRDAVTVIADFDVIVDVNAPQIPIAQRRKAQPKAASTRPGRSLREAGAASCLACGSAALHSISS